MGCAHEPACLFTPAQAMVQEPLQAGHRGCADLPAAAQPAEPWEERERKAAIIIFRGRGWGLRDSLHPVSS